MLTLFHQLKRNVQCVSYNSGGGKLWYLGLILTPEAYNKIPESEEFVCPSNPGPFKLIVDSTNPTTRERWAQATSIEHKTDARNITFTHANIAQQRASNEEALRL